MMAADDILEACARGHETTGVEFKSSFVPSNSDRMAKVARAALGMSNRQDGGHILIGVADDGEIHGVPKDDAARWTHDTVTAKLNAFADPRVELDVQCVDVDEKRVVVIQVFEFLEVPVLCKKGYTQKNQGKPSKEVLKNGGLYVRTRGEVQSRLVPSYAEMRELLDLATQKQTRRLLATMNSVGAQLAPAGPSPEELYALEREEEPTEFLTKLRSRGYWEVHLQPLPFQADRLGIAEAEAFVRQSAVSLRSWDLPQLHPKGRPTREQGFVGQAINASHHIERWRAFRSGQLELLLGERSDWKDVSHLSRVPAGWKWGEELLLEETVFRLVEVFELAARWALQLDTPQMRVSLHFGNLAGRHLTRTHGHVGYPWMAYQAEAAEFSRRNTYATAELVAGPRDLAADATCELFELFGFDRDAGWIVATQKELMRA